MVYLKPDTKLEPLVGDWYAWCHLLAPAALAMNLAHRYQVTLQSFAANPQVHVSASRDPQMFGGPFVSLPIEDRAAVADLRFRTERDAAPLLGLASDIRQLERQLQQDATGYSLESLYGSLPERLNGRVELLYDPMNRPRVRLIEELFDEPELSGAALQSVLVSSDPEETRDFFLSTPRLRKPGRLRLELPFADPRYDLLARMRTEPANLETVVAALGLGDEEAGAFTAFVCPDPPRRKSPAFNGPGVRIRYLGHACILVQTAEVTLLIDPLISSDGSAEDGRFSLCDLPDAIDYVVITHGHQDHLVPETLLQIRHKVGAVLIPQANAGNPVDPSLKLMLRALGFRDIRTLEPFDELPLPGGRLKSLPFPGEHCELDIYTRQGLHLTLGGRRMLFLVDSRAAAPRLYERIAERVGPADVAFVGMECDGAPLSWLYGPLLPVAPKRRDDESRRMSSSDAAQTMAALSPFQCKEVFIYAMGQEPWLRFLMGLEYAPDSPQLRECARLDELCRAADIPLTRLDVSAELLR